jgi:hypothetical protein
MTIRFSGRDEFQGTGLPSRIAAIVHNTITSPLQEGVVVAQDGKTVSLTGPDADEFLRNHRNGKS